MKGVGTITDIKKYKNSFFFITGDDGTVYFARRYDLADGKKAWKWCWKGNRASFDIVNEGGEHLSAKNIRPVEITDPMAEEKANRKREEKERAEEKERVKEANRERQRVLKERADKRREYESQHIRYVIQERVNDEWVNVRPYKMFTDCSKAIEERKSLNSKSNSKYRVRKLMVHKINGELVFKPVK